MIRKALHISPCPLFVIRVASSLGAQTPAAVGPRDTTTTVVLATRRAAQNPANDRHRTRPNAHLYDLYQAHGTQSLASLIGLTGPKGHPPSQIPWSRPRHIHTRYISKPSPSNSGLPQPEGIWTGMQGLGVRHVRSWCWQPNCLNHIEILPVVCSP